MKRKKEGWSIVLAGFWNRMIFTPEWVVHRLFEADAKIETVVELLPVLPIVYRDGQVAVEVSSARIVCRARDLQSDESLRRSATVAGIILGALPETPVQGIGVNFAFREDDPSPTILDLFNFTDNTSWVAAGWEVGQRKIVRQMTQDDNTLNLTLSLSDGRVDIDCNFHSVPDGNAAAIAAVGDQRIVQLRDLAIQSLEHRYELQLEVGDVEP